MNEDYIRETYQRDNETDPRGKNVGAIDKLIQMLHLQEKSNDANIRMIANNFEYIKKAAPNFTIFEAEKPDDCFFMQNFKAYQIGKDADLLVASHEFGHAILSIGTDTKVPENFDNVIKNAKEHSLNQENKEYFKGYVQYLSNKTNLNRTEAEKGPLSDIMSAIFQQPGLRINTPENVCMFPSSHSREYYYDEEKGKIKIDKVYDEIFANFYALKSGNHEKEIATLEKLFGKELIQTLDLEISKNVNNIIGRDKEKPNYPDEGKSQNNNEKEEIKKTIEQTSKEREDLAIEQTPKEKENNIPLKIDMKEMINSMIKNKSTLPKFGEYQKTKSIIQSKEPIINFNKNINKPEAELGE